MINNETQIIYDNENNKFVYINPKIIDSNKTSLNLFGDEVSDMSVSINENFIKLTQSFYSDKPPISPLIGQQWFNKKDLITYRWLGENWVQTESDITFDCYMYVKFDITTTEFVIDNVIFNFTIDNIILYNQDMKKVKFIIDPFDSKKIILKELNIISLYILIFHPKDRISNPSLNKKVELITTSGQTQFDIASILNGTNINSLSIDLNGVMLKNNEFSVTNNILTIDGMIYRVKENDKLTIWQHGGSLAAYYTNLHIETDKRINHLKIPKFFKSIMNIELIDTDNNVVVNPIEVNNMDNYIEFEFLNKKMIKSDIKIRII